MKEKSVLVVFGEDLPKRSLGKYDTVLSGERLKELIDTGNIYEASAFLDELSSLNLPSGSRLSKSFLYKGFELWWIHYNNIFNYFCLPYAQYRRLLEYLKGFQSISFYQPPYEALFSCYLRAYGREFNVFHRPRLKIFPFLPFGVFLQILVTLLSIPILMASSRRIMLFTGDKFEKSQDYDFRKKFIYEELRGRRLPFVEFIRSLESWKTVCEHALTRKRPVIYSEAVAWLGKLLNFKKLNIDTEEKDSFKKFKLLVATYYIRDVYADVWAIRIMRLILRTIGVKVAMIPTATERNFHSVLACKLNAIPIVGLLHGVTLRSSMPFDFMTGFDGEKTLSVDIYGVWSKWWKEYYIKNSKAFKPEQLYISGPIRPLKALEQSDVIAKSESGPPHILFISEEIAVPSEVMPYLRKLVDQRDIKLTIKFRPSVDGFEKWLLEHEPQILKLGGVEIVRGGMEEAVKDADVVVGTKSTAVLEALLQLKVPIFFRTQKWGDYFDMTESSERRHFFAENPEELIEKIKGACSLPHKSIADLREQYFGDPYKNGSKWVVDKIEQILSHK